jgi:predicted outer membrane protein
MEESMKSIVISLALLVPLAALANDETYGIEKKAETKDSKAYNKDKKAEEKNEKIGAQTDLSQSQLLDKLHKVSMGHVEMGNLAQTHAKSDKVKRYGEKMAKDFTQLDQQVIDYAKGHDIVLSDATGMFKSGKGEAKAEAKEEKMGNLGKLQGEDFDKQFLSSTISGCERLIPVLEGTKGKFDDSKFDRVIGKAVDTLKSYQRDAEKLQKDYAPAS